MENKDSQHKRENEELDTAAEQENQQYVYEDDNKDDQHVDALQDEKDEEVEEEERKQAPTSETPAQAAGGRSGGKAWIAVSAILAIVLIIVLIKPPFGAGDKAVATVNGAKITKDKLYDSLVEQGGKSTLDNMITTELIDQAAADAKVTVTEADVDKEIENLKKSFGSEDEFNQTLAQYGMTVDSLREDAEVQVKIRKILEPQVKVTDDDIKAYYDANKASMSTPEQIRASHILVATKEEAEDILKQLKAGADFATLAKEKSTDTGTKDNGGDLNFFGKGSMEPAFEDAAFALKKGELSGVVQTSYGYHIIKKTDEKAAVTPTLEEKKEDIKYQLVTQKVSELSSTWMADLKAKAKITNTLDPAAAEESPAASADASPEASAAAGNASTNTAK
ncbi:peptidylprolyl isomerase [Paenibacillus sp. JDR-2]|uniref:peptidylprolyl isomerase n=1 Tax=Paenibacillus sp. (strain JDR-2) TaxID=324057 RepID=UPI000166B003|nr:peptidylprolyl isomerase [Paenibacillus sp. JDR-2]ACS99124.1 PpiC-type peptidyl-prolyl cis-trans isomerase [Paenibacillus sp. JDR-2]